MTVYSRIYKSIFFAFIYQVMYIHLDSCPSFPFIVSRVGQLQDCDEQLFLLSAADFASQLLDDDKAHAFRSTFQSVAHVNPLYAKLVAAISH